MTANVKAKVFFYFAEFKSQLAPGSMALFTLSLGSLVDIISLKVWFGMICDRKKSMDVAGRGGVATHLLTLTA